MQGLDEVVLEDLCCHSQKMLILVPPNSQCIPETTLAIHAIDFSMPASFLFHQVSTLLGAFS